MYRAGILIACAAAIVIGLSTKCATAQTWPGVKKSIVTSAENMQWIGPLPVTETNVVQAA